MLQAVHTVRPVVEKFYQSLNDEQKARFNALSPDNRSAAGAAGFDTGVQRARSWAGRPQIAPLIAQAHQW
jgi:hypothetical protein